MPRFDPILDLPTPTTLERAIGERNAWALAAMQFSANEGYYRGLLDQIGELLGPKAYTSDDGSVQDSVVRAKLPELVRARLGL